MIRRGQPADHPKPVFVYMIACASTNTVVYVGSSEHPYFRVRCHRDSNQNKALKRWLRERDGSQIILIISRPKPDRKARDIENQIINFFKIQGQAEFNKLHPVNLV